MLNKMSFNVTIICDRPEDDAKKVENELCHVLTHSMHNVILEKVEWEETEGVLPLSEDDEMRQ